MKKGFTLAEVLITLAIIGVVAALTVPTVVHKYQQKELYTRFISAYNIFTNVYIQMKYNNLLESNNIGKNQLTEEILSRLKYTIKCKANERNCFGGTGAVVYGKNLSNTRSTFSFYSGYPLYTLPNGANFQITELSISGGIGNYVVTSIDIDTNGKDKSPNVLGKDLFHFIFFPYQTSPAIGATYLYDLSALASKGRIQVSKNSPYAGGVINYFCNTSNSNDSQNGISCGIKLLLEGKMDY